MRCIIFCIWAKFLSSWLTSRTVQPEPRAMRSRRLVLMSLGVARSALVMRLAQDVGPDALIVQDIGVAVVARQAGFKGELHLSTLANVSHPLALATLPAYGFSRVVLPRELSVDEMRDMTSPIPRLPCFFSRFRCLCSTLRPCSWPGWPSGSGVVGFRGSIAKVSGNAISGKKFWPRVWPGANAWPLPPSAATSASWPALSASNSRTANSGCHHICGNGWRFLSNRPSPAWISTGSMPSIPSLPTARNRSA